ncbi:GNAT family N-acetyltransferase [Sulfurisphaera ohwakuensis]|uniref:GNAT family N-acetyltransferase n=1 Tax=Sulfurisphaera ohwakuensis TaxID=69656 RepID=A0A650CKS0_SULOH|nr:GNAT family N-acetyltransferase [Sulfurisphaera ohwakuensis]MBB5253669.1 GNAT superfamily N-acetyltransferase [Sulfurisphaera ohwakuensis]QGR18348.1 GNAT family N-acetyltransferase [Sulfurisphaera ohwakuensis]
MIRKAIEKDIEALTDMFARMYRLNSEFDPLLEVPQDLEEKVRESIKKSFNKDDVLLIVVEEDGKVVGGARVFISDREFYIPQKVGIIQEIYVYPSYRRKGIGEEIINYIEKELKEKGIDTVLARFPAKNVIATSFYVKKGFRELHNEYIRNIE